LILRRYGNAEKRENLSPLPGLDIYRIPYPRVSPGANVLHPSGVPFENLQQHRMISHKKLEELLGPSGPIAREHANYEHRPGQIQMAIAVADALSERHHLCVEAGTGTGKTLAYLLPCIYSQKRVIISTGTRNLQEQLFFKDIPFLERALGRKFSVCYMKGRSNYLCLKKLDEIDGEGYLFSPHDPEYLAAIKKWVSTTQMGDRSELRDLPDDSILWHHLDARRETCTGQKCPNFESCFVTRVRQLALQSDMVIVNHHLFFADLSLRQGDFGAVLPDYSVVVFDEAHELEDIATQYFGVMASNYRVDELVRDSEKSLEEAGASSEFFAGQLAKLKVRANEFFSAFRGKKEGRFPLEELGSGLSVRRGPQRSDTISDAYRGLQSQLRVVESSLANLPVKSDSIDALVRRTSELAEQLSAVIESESAANVYWYEIRGRGLFLWASPINVDSIFRDQLFASIESAILTSATLSTGGNFQFIRSRLGLNESEELILDSHFDFGRQAIFYVPRDLPEPREEGWIRHACTELEHILEASQGRAFVLFTSYSQMQQVHESLKGRLPYPMLLQGEKSKSGLLESFRQTPNAVLFATSSFWQGVDVQGEALSCVVVDKLPFSVPSDPVVAARIRSINESGGNAFYQYQIPEAVILLKQGLGRLIRSKLDRGILALLDRRIVTKSYGRTFLQSLPAAHLTHDREEMCNFLAKSGSVMVGKQIGRKVVEKVKDLKNIR
jgi:ATP-dependent DNA helicase DinG